MAEIPRPQSGSVSLVGSGEITGLRGNMSVKKISVCDRMNSGFNGKPDSFIVDLESFSNEGGHDKDVTANSSITLQRSFSRKGFHLRARDRDSLLVASSPKAGQTGSSSALEKPAAPSQPPLLVAMGATNHSTKQQRNHHQHQITVKTGNITTATPARESRWCRRCNSFKRLPPPPWFSDPKRVVLFFATLSSIGTMLLICFTLAMSKQYGNDSSLDWQQ